MQRHRFDLSHPQFGLRYKRDRFYFMLTDFESSVRVRVENLEQDAYNIHHILRHVHNIDVVNQKSYVDQFVCVRVKSTKRAVAHQNLQSE